MKSRNNKKDKTLSSLEKKTDITDQNVAKLRTQLRKERKARKEIETKFTALERVKKTQDSTIELNAARQRMVEGQLTHKITELENKLNYFERGPIKAGLKIALFSLLRSIRRGLPLPEAFKLKMARKMTGLALMLTPPNPQLQKPQAEPLTENSKVDFEFSETDTPIISIIVPVYNEINQTIACLKSIYQQSVSVDYEVIVADDNSPDPLHKILKNIPGLRYFRNEENLQFLRNCNHNSAHARGDYIVFLNNDTIVKPAWLEELFQTFMTHNNVGIAGSKLIYPNGNLQEAGGIIWEDASGWNWGKGQNSDHPLYNFVRDVDYVSGASLMISTALWNEIGGFNEALEKAYYEDTDICFRARSMGYRILYQPASEVVHLEGLTSGIDETEGAKQYQTINQKIFKETWQSTLDNHLPNATTPLLASDRGVKGHILYIDAVTPEPNKDSGSVDAVYSMRILIELGYRVHFIPGSNFTYWGDATKYLQKMGVECIYAPFYSNIQNFLDDRGDMFDYIVISRAECADLMLSTLLKKCPNAKIIYNTVDLHFMRMEREAKIRNKEEITIAAKAMKTKEIGFIEKTDATIVLSEVEHSLLSQKRSLKDKLWVIPLVRPETKRLVEFETTKDIIFIGGYNHTPNVDAVEWLVKDIWPEIRKVLPGVKLHICGSSMPPHFEGFASEDILIRGFVPDLDALLSETRLTIAPLRFGAGLKGKVASSIGVGVPCIGTDIAFEGMAEQALSDIRFLAKTPKGFARIAKQIYGDKERWTKASHAGVRYHNENYAYKNVSRTYTKMLESLTQ